MRLRSLLLLATALSMLATPRVSEAAQLPFTGTLSIAVGTLPAIGISGSGSATLDSQSGTLRLDHLSLPSGAFSEHAFTLSVTATSVAPIAGLQITAVNGAGSLTRGAGGRLHGSIPVQGIAKVCLFAACNQAPLANVSVPVNVVGAGGTATASGAVNVTVQGAPWTTGTAAIGTLHGAGSAAGPLGQASSTAQPGGRLNLVTPIFISTNLGSLPVVPTLGRIQMSFGQPPPSCDVATSQPAYGDGDLLVLSALHFTNPGTAAVDVRIGLEFVVPIGSGLVVPVFDTDATLPAGFDRDLGPLSAFPVAPSQPRGAYELRCRVIDAASGATIHEGVASFTFQ